MKSLALITLLALAQAEAPSDRERDPVTTMEAAVTAYRAMQFREAGDLFVEVFEQTKVPAQLRNAAKAYTDGDLFDAAVLTWRRYRALDGLEASAVAEADAQIRFIEERRSAEAARAEAEAAKQRAEDAERERREAEARAEAERRDAEAEREAQPGDARTVTPPPVVTSPPPSSPYGAYVTTGVGAAALIVAGALYLHADARLDRLDDQLAMTNASGQVVGVDRADAMSDLEGINAERNASAIVAGVGVATVAIGIAWWLLTDELPEPGQSFAFRF